MGRHPNDATTDAMIDAALEQAKCYRPTRIVEASYERGLDLFVLRLSNGRRLVYPRENLQAVATATPEQAAVFVIGPYGTDIWWPRLDEGHSLPNLLEGRSGNATWNGYNDMTLQLSSRSRQAPI